MSAPELSVVAPLHNEEENVRPLFEAIVAAIEPLGRPFEVLLVNDGSSDRTAELLDALSAADPRLRPIHLDGNFGEAAGLSAGFEAARGEFVLTLDGDLQNDPADLPRLLALLESGGYRAVSGWRRKRQEGFAKRILPSLIANRLIAWVTGVPSRDNGCGLKVYRSEVVRGVCLPHGLHRFMPAVFGVRAEEFSHLEVSDRRRQAGRSHYGLSRFFPVVRDLLVIPYIRRGARQSLGLVTALACVAAGLILAGAFLLAAHGVTMGAGLEAAGLLLGVYALLVRANLERWLRAQAEKTFRVKGVQPAEGTPVGSETLRGVES
jgi:glycosyltransferase involved in cell wall biosynthesis